MQPLSPLPPPPRRHCHTSYSNHALSTRTLRNQHQQCSFFVRLPIFFSRFSCFSLRRQLSTDEIRIFLRGCCLRLGEATPTQQRRVRQRMRNYYGAHNMCTHWEFAALPSTGKLSALIIICMWKQRGRAKRKYFPCFFSFFRFFLFFDGGGWISCWLCILLPVLFILRLIFHDCIMRCLYLSWNVKTTGFWNDVFIADGYHFNHSTLNFNRNHFLAFAQHAMA